MLTGIRFFDPPSPPPGGTCPAGGGVIGSWESAKGYLLLVPYSWGRVAANAASSTILAAVSEVLLFRIIQYKMIMKRDRFPIQDDHEMRVSGPGVLRPDADTHAEQREPDAPTDQRFFKGQRGDRLQRGQPGGSVRLGGAGAGGPRVPGAEQKGPGSDSRLRGEGHRAEHSAGDTAHPEVQEHGPCDLAVLPAAAVPAQIHRTGHRAVSPGGPRARAAERTGHTVHPEARAREVRQGGVWAIGGNLGVTSVQPAPEHELPETGGDVRAHASHPGLYRRAAQTRSAR